MDGTVKKKTEDDVKEVSHFPIGMRHINYM